MKIDRMPFETFKDALRENETVAKAVEAGQWDRVIEYVNRETFGMIPRFKSKDYVSLNQLAA